MAEIQDGWQSMAIKVTDQRRQPNEIKVFSFPLSLPSSLDKIFAKSLLESVKFPEKNLKITTEPLRAANYPQEL